MRTPLIAGIDPGTTLGYAVIDLFGKLLVASSSRTMRRGELIDKLTMYGTPVLIGTDKHHIPQLVQEVAAKFGANIFHPPQDLQREEKRQITKEYHYTNDHERDAHACALAAYQKHRQLFLKAETVLKKIHKIHLEIPVKAALIKNPYLSIRLAIEILETKSGSDRSRLERIANRKQTVEDIRYLYDKQKEMDDHNLVLQDQIERLRDQVRILSSELGVHRKKSAKNELVLLREKKLTNKDQTIAYLNDVHKKDVQTIQQYKQQNTALHRILMEKDEYVIIPHLPTLGSGVWHNLEKGSIIFINDPTIVSQQTIDLLREKVEIIIHRVPISAKLRNTLPFHFISAAQLTVIDLSKMVCIPKRELEREKKKLKFLEVALREFEEERERSKKI